MCQHIIPVHKRVIKLDQQIFQSPQDPVMSLHDVHQDLVFLRNLDDRLRPLEIYLERT